MQRGFRNKPSVGNGERAFTGHGLAPVV
jgi:hypothetical protein